MSAPTCDVCGRDAVAIVRFSTHSSTSWPYCSRHMTRRVRIDTRDGGHVWVSRLAWSDAAVADIEWIGDDPIFDS